MPGSPLKRAVSAELERRTRTEWPDEPERTQLEWVAQYQAGGGLLKTLADECKCSPAFLREYLRVKFGADAVRDALRRAREEGAHSLVEEALIKADVATPENANAVRLQVQTRQWVAERWNAAELGGQKQQGMTINIGTLMLEALRQPSPPVSGIAAAIVEEAQLLSADNAETCEVEQ